MGKSFDERVGYHTSPPVDQHEERGWRNSLGDLEDMQGELVRKEGTGQMSRGEG